MSRLHPTARALVAAAKRQEEGLPPETRERVHASVLQRAAFGAATGAAATSATTAAAKTGVAALVSGHPFVAGGLALVVATGSGLAIGKAWRANLDDVVAAHSAEPAARSAPLHVAVAPPPPPPENAAAPGNAVAPSTAATTAPSVETPAAQVVAPAMPVKESFAPSQAPSPRGAGPQTLAPSNAPSSAQVVPSLTASAMLMPVPSGTVSPAPSALPSSDATAAAPDPLSVELPILRRIHEELRAHHPAQALGLLDQYASVLRTGPLVEEAELARVSALCQIGSTDDARSAIERFVARWPGSPMAVALQNGCPSEDSPTGAARNRHGSR